MSGACSALATGWPGIAVLPGLAHSPWGVRKQSKIIHSSTSNLAQYAGLVFSCCFLSPFQMPLVTMQHQTIDSSTIIHGKYTNDSVIPNFVLQHCLFKCIARNLYLKLFSRHFLCNTSACDLRLCCCIDSVIHLTYVHLIAPCVKELLDLFH